eukprot:15463239-Alexandrium_andersonii.AAC.1
MLLHPCRHDRATARGSASPLPSPKEGSWPAADREVVMAVEQPNVMEAAMVGRDWSSEFGELLTQQSGSALASR